MSELKEQVREFWEQEPCGTGEGIVGESEPLTLEWFEQVERHRYSAEPFIHGVAQFTRHRGKKLLEIGVGAGTDHLQWARAGAVIHGVDLTQAAIDTTRARLAAYGFESQLQRVDAETLPFPDGMFDVVYSWGVIHHSENPRAILEEAHRVLKPGGVFLGMLYRRHSLAILNEWIKHALLKGKPWRSFRDVTWHHVESVGTKAYTLRELRELLDMFSDVQLRRYVTPYDTAKLPRRLHGLIPDLCGAFVGIRAVR